jgi:signal transduction histidine kinase
VDLFEVTRAAARGRAAVDWNAGRTVVRADPRRLSQALGNLVANAEEHGRGPVVVRGRRVGTRVRIEVADRGPGIVSRKRRRRWARAGLGPASPGRGRRLRSRDVRGRGLIVADAAARDAGARLETSGHPVIDIPITRP